ncbi:MAG: hypothetical protein NZ578_11760 [Candidatus Binatia bacterium]|nr:hypothetical protein [Candidatus Binatia bacterium]
MPKALCVLPLLLCHLACSWQEHSSQMGHQHIAAAIRELLNRAYAGIDYSTYRDGLTRVEAVVADHLPNTPHHLRNQVVSMLAYLRTAEEILRWQARLDAEHADHTVTRWIDRYPFLQMAVGARAEAPQLFDAQTAVALLWDKTDEVLRGLQLKSGSL